MQFNRQRVTIIEGYQRNIANKEGLIQVLKVEEFNSRICKEMNIKLYQKMPGRN